MTTRRARLRRKIYAKLPRWLKRHDFELFAAILSIVGGIPILLGQVDPSSPEDILPRPLVLVWASVLVIGGFSILVGVLLGSYRVFPERIFWMRVEAFGLTALAYFCYLYTFSILLVAIEGGWTAAAIIFALGAVSHVREVAIQMELEDYRRNLGLEERV